jgi:hypothetical protein
VAGVILDSKNLVVYIKQIVLSKGGDVTYELFNHFLSYILLLVMGLELAQMLIRRTPESIAQVMLYAIARKTLIHSNKMSEVLIGVVAFEIIFVLLRFI